MNLSCKCTGVSPEHRYDQKFNPPPKKKKFRKTFEKYTEIYRVVGERKMLVESTNLAMELESELQMPAS